MRGELSNRSPALTDRKHSMAIEKLVSEKKASLKDIDEKIKEKKKMPLFYTTPIFKANNYEFY